MNYQSKKYIACSIVFFSFFIKAQDITTVKDQDTVFILFKPSEKFKKLKTNKELTFEECMIYSYYYMKNEFVSFRCCYNLDVEKKTSFNTIKRRWLKKQNIITEDFFKNNEYVVAKKMLSNKILFIIEAKNYKKRKIPIKQTTFFSFSMEGTDDLMIKYEELKVKDSVPKQ